MAADAPYPLFVHNLDQILYLQSCLADSLGGRK